MYMFQIKSVFGQYAYGPDQICILVWSSTSNTKWLFRSFVCQNSAIVGKFYHIVLIVLYYG